MELRFFIFSWLPLCRGGSNQKGLTTDCYLTHKLSYGSHAFSSFNAFFRLASGEGGGESHSWWRHSGRDQFYTLATWDSSVSVIPHSLINTQSNVSCRVQRRPCGDRVETVATHTSASVLHEARGVGPPRKLFWFSLFFNDYMTETTCSCALCFLQIALPKSPANIQQVCYFHIIMQLVIIGSL